MPPLPRGYNYGQIWPLPAGYPAPDNPEADTTPAQLTHVVPGGPEWPQVFYRMIMPQPTQVPYTEPAERAGEECFIVAIPNEWLASRPAGT